MMPPAQPHRRPQPGRRPVAAAAVRPVDQAIRAPWFAAFLRRHPRLARQSSVGAIAGGVVLFVIACVTTPLAAANVASPTLNQAAAPPLDPVFTDLAIDPVAPAVQKTLKRDPS